MSYKKNKTINQGKTIQSIDRALDILELIAKEGSLRMKEISSQINLHKATVHGILRTLQIRYFLINDNGVYSLGPQAMVLTLQSDKSKILHSIIGEYLDEISARTKEVACCAILKDHRLEILKVSLPPTDVIAQITPGKIFENPFLLAAGRLLVAHSSRDTWEEYINRHWKLNPEYDEENGYSKKKWLNELEKIKSEKICFKKDPTPGGTSSIAIPVTAASDIILASIGVHIPNFRYTDTLYEEMKKILIEISYKINLKTER